MSHIFGRFVGVRVGVARSEINLRCERSSGICMGGLWALEWAWHCAETNLRCAGISGICFGLFVGVRVGVARC